MDLAEFFKELTERAELALEELSPTKRATTSLSGNLYGFLHFIRQVSAEQAKNEEDRNEQVIHSAWIQTKAFGTRLKLFEKYRGDERLRIQLLDFLNSTIPANG